ncbi:hypothetical protein E3N88_42795 [Mikania micrantha]|uniref:V-ATPase proteolipid subunit C-like domain-containing protein n=1 Tax=Mikania micrantha TaxID=192012 RepID=A0A5N6LGR4_9ASTR|nr:hypothetical protein E3N88_42795 [Mikania micrantha]
MSSPFSGDETAPFFGFLGAAAALVFLLHGGGIWDSKEWCWSGVNGSDEARIGDEVDCAGGYGWSAKSYYLFDGYAHLSSGLACGLAGLSAGMAIGIVGDAGVRANAQQPKLFVGMILILIFAEALALYGLIVGIILSSRAGQSRAD